MKGKMMNPNRTIKELREELSRLCKVSTQGSWWIDSHGGTMVSFSEDEDMKIVFSTSNTMGPLVRHDDTGNLSHWPNDNDASYIATAHPENIQKLLEEMSRLESGNNAWNTVHRFVREDLGEDIAAIRDESSRKLHAQNCQSAAVHTICFIESLIERIHDLESDLRGAE